MYQIFSYSLQDYLVYHDKPLFLIYLHCALISHTIIDICIWQFDLFIMTYSHSKIPIVLLSLEYQIRCV